ncbi:deoxyribodipyrimidine photo-lyase [Chryseobacterium indologenes]|uniref:Deoxyribodipyrimidine photo-lyase n=1 Tax=Chryseobacterium indologenes TaxID=253 RepID=A0AAD0YTW1_CHRID|nr:deoxyribodipyrimidine photo-lyase [Chryseobacterium indologenes]ATN05638.1 deoxyribodipyrimidine photo-lyase [Chryseobacterium indologenes]AYY85605.1 deoxyribodipyrimidine photo-lyase [Chryseobacterium indologenes]AZB17288.1 deoxyribodipyrimidine photo-lyase [Chryseobacterium indologenes]QIX82502.1 deoxyribodipyrimidine photo-lyase [Chryseobacterium indologenes]TLX26293.1 deoxyribodipyrimidine photo-lyase [Chryseobacterium indologenes]
MNKVNVFWFRRDLRLRDNIGLHHALNSGLKVIPVFIFDTVILDQLHDKSDKRVDYIHQALQNIHEELLQHQSGLYVYHGTPAEVFEKIKDEFPIDTVFCNRDYEPQAILRDQHVAEQLSQHQIHFKDFKDQVIFEKNDIVKNDGSPYTVFTPYSKRWKEKLKKIESVTNTWTNFASYKGSSEILSLKKIGFEKTDIEYTVPVLDKNIIDSYGKYRDFPALDHTTHLGIALRFGTVSIRKCVQYASEHSEVWLNELIWREFFMQILYHFPKVVHHCFKKKYENIAWRNNEEDFKAWCEGKTGYPIVDAGMRELNETGFMHNRVRMITASFLTKHLLIDWRWGEAYFAEKLLDYDLSANNGNWQWAAGCGCDAAPYFRIFNPYEQAKKFDKNAEYVKKWLPENYKEEPVIEHTLARERALKTYKDALAD